MTQLLDLLRDNPFTALLGGIVTALSGYLVARRNTAPSVQESLNNSVAKMIEHYTQALESGRKEIADLKVEVITLKHMTLDLARTIESLPDHIEELHAHIDDLTAAMLAARMTPPSRPPARLSQVTDARAQAASVSRAATDPVPSDVVSSNSVASDFAASHIPLQVPPKAAALSRISLPTVLFSEKIRWLFVRRS